MGQRRELSGRLGRAGGRLWELRGRAVRLTVDALVTAQNGKADQHAVSSNTYNRGGTLKRFWPPLGLELVLCVSRVALALPDLRQDLRRSHPCASSTIAD